MAVTASSGRPYGLMRLSDMINCYVGQLYALSSHLSSEITQLTSDLNSSYEEGRLRISPQGRRRMESWLNICRDVARDFELEAVHDRIEIFSQKLNQGITVHEFLAELRVLQETIKCGVDLQFVYKYPRDKSPILDRWSKDWAHVLAAFPSSEEDIVAGIDCWALGHPTACVFHMMRVLEHGLRALATDVGKTFDIQNWQNILDEIEAQIREIGKTMARGATKNERLRFLSEAAKEFRYFKDGWRNYVAHNRVTYDEDQARSAAEHVREFMTVLAARLHEHGE